MSNNLLPQELMMSLNYLFPDALESGNIDDYTDRIAESLQQVIAAELDRLQVRHSWYSTRFLHLGTDIISDSTRCSECDRWVVPEDNFHQACVVDSGWRFQDNRFLCDQCCSGS